MTTTKRSVWRDHQGWGLLSRFPPFRYFPIFSASPKYMLASEYHVHIWQVSPQLSCGDTSQIWMWCKESNRYLGRIDKFAYGEISERSFSDPHPWIGNSVPVDRINWQLDKDLQSYILIFPVKALNIGKYLSIWLSTSPSLARRLST